MKWILVLLLPSFVYALDRQEFREFMTPKSSEMMLEKHRFKKSTPPYFIDLNNDGKKENIQITYADGHFYISLLSGSNYLATHKVRVEGGEARIQRFLLEDIGRGMSALLFYIEEGQFETIDQLYKRRVDVITFNREKMKNSYYFEGPLIEYSKVSWDMKEKIMRADVSFVKFANKRYKSILIDDAQSSKTLVWNADKKTWY